MKKRAPHLVLGHRVEHLGARRRRRRTAPAAAATAAPSSCGPRFDDGRDELDEEARNAQQGGVEGVEEVHDEALDVGAVVVLVGHDHQAAVPVSFFEFLFFLFFCVLGGLEQRSFRVVESKGGVGGPGRMRHEQNEIREKKQNKNKNAHFGQNARFGGKRGAATPSPKTHLSVCSVRSSV